MAPIKLGFFTRLLERASAGDRYQFALEQAQLAEQLGYDTVWVAQHHFHAEEGGLPSPFVFFSHLAARTSRIHLGTGVITLPLENTIRVAEDAVVLDLLSGGRFEFGIGSGATDASLAAFGVNPPDRAKVYEAAVHQLIEALRGHEIAHPENRLYPSGESLLDRIWQSTFSSYGGTRSGLPGHGLLVSRSQPRPADQPDLPLAALQQPILDAYLAALPDGVAPRILASRTLVVTDTEAQAEQYLHQAFDRYLSRPGTGGGLIVEAEDAHTWARRTDTYIGTPEQVIASLQADPIIPQSTEVAFQVHSIDPGHEATLRSLELIAEKVAPALGWESSVNSSAAVPAGVA